MVEVRNLHRILLPLHPLPLVCSELCLWGIFHVDLNRCHYIVLGVLICLDLHV